MNNSITENNKKRYLPHDINTRKYAVEMQSTCWDTEYDFRPSPNSRDSLSRSTKVYDVTK